MKRITMMLMAFVLMPLMALATTYYVNGTTGNDSNTGLSASVAKKTIQAAIDAAADGSTILVASGTYGERLEVTRNITLWSVDGPEETIIQGSAGNSVIHITSDATDATIRGFTITGGTGRPSSSSYGYDYYGGGVCSDTTANIRDCIIHGNGHGTPRTNSGTFGGGLCGRLTVSNCLLYDNYAWACGGATFVEGGTMELNKCTIYGNDSTDFFGYQGGVGMANNGSVIVKNCIVWNNGGNEIDAYSSPYNSGTAVNVSYSCVEGGVSQNHISSLTRGSGNISSSPNFVNASANDYSLDSDSPCIGTADDGGDMGFSIARIENPNPLVQNQLYSGWFEDLSGCYACDATTFPTTTNIVSRPVLANSCSQEESRDEYRTTVYWGEMYLAAGTYRFAGNFDDYIYVNINGEIVLEGNWDYMHFGNITIPTSGWYPIELRFHNNGDIHGDTYAHYGYGWACRKCLCMQDITSNPSSTDTDPSNFTVLGLDENGNEVPGLFRLPNTDVQGGLVAWYKFDGNANDSSGNGNYLTGDASNYSGDHRGRNESALYMSGTNFLTPAKDLAIENDMAISVWVKPEDDFDESMGETLDNGRFWTQAQFVVYPAHGGYGDTEMAGVGLIVGRNGVVVMEHRDGYYARTIVWRNNIGSNWTHVAVTIAENGAPKLYVNGAFVKEGLASSWIKYLGTRKCEWIDDDSIDTLIGGGRDGYFKGGIDELRFYNRALSAAEVRALYVLPGDLPVEGAAFHVDASALSTMNVVERDGQRYVTRWNDASGGERYAVAGENQPTLGTYNGRTVVDFGDMWFYGCGHAENTGAWMTWSSADTSIRDVFVVCCDHEPVSTSNSQFPFLLSCDYFGNTLDSCAFHRNYRQLFSSEFASSAVLGGIIQVDGQIVPYNYTLPSGYHIIRVQTTGNVAANTFCKDRECRFGGQYLAEAVVYDSPLSEADAKKVYDYLLHKWFSGLIHRWSFNGSLVDSVGGATATSLGSHSWTSDGKSISLPGGSRGTSGIDLGANLLPTDGTPVTIEIWAKNREQQSWSRIFDLGSGTEYTDNLFMSWTRGTEDNTDRVELHDGGVSVGTYDEMLTPYELGREYHISMVITPNCDGDGKTEFVCAKRDSNSGTILRQLTWKTSRAWSLSDIEQNVFYLGRSEWTVDYDATADFNEVRIWNRALTEAELTQNAQLGPDVLPGATDPTVYRTVTFDANGGTADEATRQVVDGAAVGTLPTATRTGYRFLGWFTEVSGGTEVTETTDVTSDGTCYAHWQANEYTIAFEGNGSTGGSTAGLSVAYDADATLTANGFTKTGYSFAGWSQRAIGTVEYADRATVRNLTDENGATVTLYAVWTPIDYSVSFYGNGADWGSMSSQWFTYDSWENLNANQYGKTGYSFDGWATTAGGSVVYENGASVVNLASTAGADVGLFAKWRVNQYTITFNANGGSTDMSSVTRDYGTAIGSMTDAWRTGYDFLGWFTSSSGGSQATAQTVISGDVTLYAHWQHIPIAFGDMEFDCGGDSEWILSNVGDGADDPTIAQSGIIGDNGSNWIETEVSGRGVLRFDWKVSSESGCDRLVCTVDGATKLNVSGERGWEAAEIRVDGAYDHIIRLEYSKDGSVSSGSDCAWIADVTWSPAFGVTFDANGGSVDETLRYVEMSSPVGTLPDATRTGYAFLGWFTEVSGGAEVTETTEVTSDGTCYAHWQANEYTIAFEGNGSTGGSTAGLSVAYDAEATLSANGFTKTGYSFAGWSRYNWGDVEYGDQDTVCNLTDENGATVTLYAVWTPIDYSVSFYGNGADWGSMSSQWFTYDSWENLIANQYGKTGYSFDGWATTAGGSVVYENGASVVNLASTAGADVGLFAKWRVNQYTITFNANGGSTDMSSVTRDYGTAIGSMTDAWRTGYDFLGWFTSSSGGSQATAKTTVTGNATLYAHWQLKTYTITVDANGGDAVPSFTRQHGSTIGSLPIPSRVGHVFKGWFTSPEGGDRVGVSQVVTSDLALYAHWSTYAQEIAEAMPGASNVRFSTDDSAPWTRDASVSSDGESVRSYPVTAGGESAMEAQVYGSGNFMFDWRVSSASRVGVLTYYVDGVQKKQISGSVDWRTVDIEISGEGTHTVRWVYAKSGSDVSGSDCGWVDAISWSGGSFPFVSYTVSFNVNGGDASIPSVTRESGTAIGTLPTPTRANATFLGWFTAASGGTQVTAGTTVTANMTIYAHWKVNDSTPGNCTVTFNANGGTCSTKATTVASGSSVGTLPTATRTGYAFVGWFTAASGGSQVSDSSIVSASVTWYAHWQANTYKITYVDTKDAENPNPTTYTIANAVTFADLPNVDGWRFVGWSMTGIPAGSTGDKTVTANWETAPDIGGGGEDDDPMDASIANTYDGVIVDADGLPKGYINVKATKASGRGDAKTTRVTATIQMVGETKKVTIKASVPVAEATFTAKSSDDRVLDLTFSKSGIWGTFDGYEIDGVRNLLTSTAKSDKGTDAKVAAEAAFTALKGNYVLAFEDDNGWNGLSITVMTKGKVKVSGKLANGTSVSTTSQLIVGDDYSVIPVIYAKGSTSLAFNIYFPNDGGEAEVFGYCNAVISTVSSLDSGLSFYIGDSVYDLFDDYTLCEEFLPYGISVEPSGRKLVVAGGAKAGSIKLRDGEVVDTKDSDNPSGLKLTFNSRAGTFSGSFKVYAIDSRDKLKTFTATISGVVVDGFGYGVATIRKIGSCAVTIAE